MNLIAQIFALGAHESYRRRMATFLENLDVTWRAVAGTTERGARRRGAGAYLPALFADRFARMAGIDRQLMVDQLAACRTFEDAGWSRYWTALAEEQITTVDAVMAAASAPSVDDLLSLTREEASAAIHRVLGPAASSLDHRATARPDDSPTDAVRSSIRAITYLFAAAWPGLTPHRLEAYRRSRALFELLLHGLAPSLGVDVETIEAEAVVDGVLQRVRAIAVLPRSEAPAPAVLVTNGLEGTIQELLLPLIGYRDRGLAVVCMEMPGTYLHPHPLTSDSSALYTAVIDAMATHPRLDAERLAMVGFSFGANWSSRMGALDPRLRAVVSNGGLLHHSLRPTAAWGMPEIMLEALAHTTGSTHPLATAQRLRRLSVRHLYRDITAPLLVINGDHDTLASTQDSIDLARESPRGELVLYPGDDHCAMGHYDEWLDHTVDWLTAQL